MRIAGSGNPALAAGAAAAVFGRDQAKIGHQMRRLLEPSKVSQFREQHQRGHSINSFQCRQRCHYR